MATSSTGAPSFTACTMSKGQLAAAYGLKTTRRLHAWCSRVGIDLPPKIHILDPKLVADVVEKLGTPFITISATRM